MNTWDALIEESRRLEEVASKIQNGKVVGLPQEKIKELINDYQRWYGKCLAHLPEDLKAGFRFQYEVSTKRFLEAAAVKNSKNVEYSYSLGRHTQQPLSYWKYPYEKWFYFPLLTQRQLLIEANERVEENKREPESSAPSETSVEEQLRPLLGYLYRKPLEPRKEDIEAGIITWSQNLTQKQEHGEKLEVALLNALSRLGVPSFFTGSALSGGTETPVIDLVAIGLFTNRLPTAVLISCKSKNQPNLGEIGKLSDEAARVSQLLSGWIVFGTLALPEEPTAQDFNYRQDIRIWKKSHLQMILHAHERKHVDMLLWTPPWHWNSQIEGIWLSMYKAYHKDVFNQ